MVCTFMLGNQELYDFADDNPSVLVLDGAYVNDPYVIAKNDNMVSINTTLEIDLTGQCCSESIGSRQFSGTGGQADTAIGAQNSKNGRSIIALYSTAMVKNKATGEREEVSKIVPILKPGAIVSLSRNDVDIVVTEYGAAYLRGTTVKERVEALIAIALFRVLAACWFMDDEKKLFTSRTVVGVVMSFVLFSCGPFLFNMLVTETFGGLPIIAISALGAACNVVLFFALAFLVDKFKIKDRI